MRQKFTLEFEVEIDTRDNDGRLFDRYRFILYDSLKRGRVSLFDGKEYHYPKIIKQKFTSGKFE